MEDLDALLADLQSTTEQISSYQHQKSHHNYNHSEPGTERSSTFSDVTSQYSSDYQYSSQRLSRSSSSYISSDTDSRSSTPPPLPPPPPGEVIDKAVIRQGKHSHQVASAQQSYRASGSSTHSNTAPVINGKPVKTRPVMSSLSNNLSELDQLLQDLGSAQFMEEVDKRNAVNEQLNTSGDQTTVVTTTKFNKSEKRTSVDNLIDALEDNLTVTPQTQNVPTKRGSYDYPPESLQPRPMGNKAVASSATQELDDLMASLSNFKSTLQGDQPVGAVVETAPPQQQQQQYYEEQNIYEEQHFQTSNDTGNIQKQQQQQQQQQIRLSRQPSLGDPNYAKPHKGRGQELQSPGSPPAVAPVQSSGQLDAMLGNLQCDMNRQGVSTKTKGNCAACNKPVAGQVITALGRVWHIEHFVCAHCKQEIGTNNFFERDGHAYCEQDYHQLFAPRCAYCNGPIIAKCVTALDKTWHPEHFFCSQCGQPFGDEDFHEKDGKAYCRDDYLQMFAPKCGGCLQPITDNYISALNKHWHASCFGCRDCGMGFGGGSFFDHDGFPYCETHYHAKRGSLCSVCQKPITGRCITAMYKKFHPEHFVCAFCLKQLNKGTFKEQNDKPYCHPCFVKLYG